MLKRVLATIPALFGVTVLIFLAMRVLPGDPLAMIAGEGGSYILKDEELRAARTSLGFDKPLYRQYVDWIADVARGDFGKSFWRKEPIRETIFRRAPISGQIAFMAIVISWVVGVPVGIISAIWRNSIPDYITRVFVILFVAVPAFWVALVVVLVCVLLFSWRPPITIVYFWEDPLANLQMTLGPAFVLGIGERVKGTSRGVAPCAEECSSTGRHGFGSRAGRVAWRFSRRRASLLGARIGDGPSLCRWRA
jgi:peptide/nickel transport system permease protein